MKTGQSEDLCKRKTFNYS